MARIVYVTSGLVGVLNSGLELASRLRAAGHDVTVVGWRDVGEVVESRSFPYVRLDDDDRLRTRVRDEAGRVGKVRAIPLARRLRRELIASTEIEDVLRRLDPELTLIDIEVHTAVIAATGMQLPFATRLDLLSVFRDWSNPPLHTSATVPTTWREHLRCRWLWARTIVGRYAGDALGILHPGRLATRLRPFSYGTVSRADLVAFARPRGVRLRDIASRAHWLLPHLYTHVPMIRTTFAELELPGSSQRDELHVGPMIHDGHVDSRAGDEALGRWWSFRERQLAGGAPLVYCGLGTLNPSVADRVRTVVDAVRSRPDLRLVVGLGGSAAAGEFGDVPDHVLVLDYAPQLDVLRDASVAVVHGGINTIHECLWTGVPMVLPIDGMVDQPGNAVRVEHHGLGVRVDLDGGSAPLIEAVDRVLADPGYRERLDRSRALFAEYDGRLERAVDRLVRDLTPSPGSSDAADGSTA